LPLLNAFAFVNPTDRCMTTRFHFIVLFIVFETCSVIAFLPVLNLRFSVIVFGFRVLSVSTFTFISELSRHYSLLVLLSFPLWCDLFFSFPPFAFVQPVLCVNLSLVFFFVLFAGQMTLYSPIIGRKCHFSLQSRIEEDGQRKRFEDLLIARWTQHHFPHDINTSVVRGLLLIRVI